MNKKLYEAPEMELIKLKRTHLLTGSSDEQDPEQGSTSDEPYSGEGL